jgi:hypothetical protein
MGLLLHTRGQTGKHGMVSPKLLHHQKNSKPRSLLTRSWLQSSGTDGLICAHFLEHGVTVDAQSPNKGEGSIEEKASQKGQELDHSSRQCSAPYYQ